MANWRVLAIGSMLFFITEVPVIKAQVAPVAEAPTYQVGDEWRYADGRTRRVVAIEGDQVVTASTPDRLCPDCRGYRDKNFTLTKVIDKNGQPVYEPSVGLKRLEFPMKVGNQWISHQNLKSGGGRILFYENTFTVEEYTEVLTKAGTFKAFKIIWKQTRSGSHPWVGQAALWYSPDVKAIVKTDGDARWFHGTELESYTLKQRAILLRPRSP